MEFRHAVIGAGRKEKASAHDLALYGQSSEIIMTDLYENGALSLASRINRLTGHPIAKGLKRDASFPFSFGGLP